MTGKDYPSLVFFSLMELEIEEQNRARGQASYLCSSKTVHFMVNRRMANTASEYFSYLQGIGIEGSRPRLCECSGKPTFFGKSAAKLKLLEVLRE